MKQSRRSASCSISCSQSSICLSRLASSSYPNVNSYSQSPSFFYPVLLQMKTLDVFAGALFAAQKLAVVFDAQPKRERAGFHDRPGPTKEKGEGCRNFARTICAGCAF